ncbi:MAG: hypothetical protein Q8M65_01975, partial [Rhodoglobus sp.]|nr:hypothetical protein [Rhodoglobus sp.]
TAPRVVRYLPDGGMLVAGGRFDYLERIVQGLMILEPVPAPAILAQPANQTAAPGDTVTFSLTAAGENLAYQWRKNGNAIDGATNATLSLPNVQVADVADYSVVLTNLYGTATSASATIIGGAPATILTQPGPITVVAGESATLSVNATGSSALSYLWRRNGVALPGATASTLAFATPSMDDSDWYDVVVYNGLTALSSSPARLAINPARVPGNVQFDASFTPRFEKDHDFTVYALAPAADGKYYAAGDFSRVGTEVRWRIARFLADHTLDPSFVPPAIDGAIRAISVQLDGKVVVGGEFSRLGTASSRYLARLNVDGAPDPTFDGLGSGPNSAVECLIALPDGKLLVGGNFFSFGAHSNTSYLVRLHPNGGIDSTFARGSGPTGSVISLARQTDGKILLGGQFFSYNGSNAPRLARIQADGTFDATFVVGNGPTGAVEAIAVDASNRVLIGGSFGFYNSVTTGPFVRLSATGALDTAFASATGTGLGVYIYDLAVLADGRIAVGVGGQSSAMTGNVLRFSDTGQRDTAFAPDVAKFAAVRALLPLGEGSLLAAGLASTAPDGQAIGGLRRLAPTGEVVSSFVSLRAPARIY